MDITTGLTIYKHTVLCELKKNCGTVYDGKYWPLELLWSQFNNSSQQYSAILSVQKLVVIMELTVAKLNNYGLATISTIMKKNY
jgi:hypothetical protein